jgi:branched-chain amino acid transport system ATP-binding protein
MTDLLVVQGLNAGYGEAQVLQDVSFRLQPGQTLALLGRNGTGKTTLINSLMGVTDWMGGSIELNGQQIQTWPSYRRATGLVEGGLGWVPQERNIFKSLTVHENLTAVAHGHDKPAAWTPDRAYALFPRLAQRRMNLGHQLSGGEQQMLALARALVLNPSLLLLDEPMEGLAPVIVDEILTALKQLTHHEGLSAIIVEQHPQMVLSISDTVLVLERGQVVHQGLAADLKKQTELLHQLLGAQA